MEPTRVLHVYRHWSPRQDWAHFTNVFPSPFKFEISFCSHLTQKWTLWMKVQWDKIAIELELWCFHHRSNSMKKTRRALLQIIQVMGYACLQIVNPNEGTDTSFACLQTIKAHARRGAFHDSNSMGISFYPQPNYPKVHSANEISDTVVCSYLSLSLILPLEYKASCMSSNCTWPLT